MIHSKEAKDIEPTEYDIKLGSWMSAALSDDDVCEEMKQDIRNWLSQFNNFFKSHEE